MLCHLTNPATTKVANITQCFQKFEIIHAYLLQKYASLRTNKQEAFYNLGRAAHQLNLTHLAVPWYQQALSAEPAKAFTTLGDTLTEDREAHIDLTRVIAYNLTQIYIASGSEALARKVMRDHLTVWVAILAKLDKNFKDVVKCTWYVQNGVCRLSLVLEPSCIVVHWLLQWRCILSIPLCINFVLWFVGRICTQINGKRINTNLLMESHHCPVPFYSK